MVLPFLQLVPNDDKPRAIGGKSAVFTYSVNHTVWQLGAGAVEPLGAITIGSNTTNVRQQVLGPVETLQDADANLDEVARNTRSVTITSDMADSSGNIDAIVYADEFATDDNGCNRHGFVEVNGERANLADPTSVQKFQQLNIANTGPEYQEINDNDPSEGPIPDVANIEYYYIQTESENQTSGTFECLSGAYGYSNVGSGYLDTIFQTYEPLKFKATGFLY